jgi:hypothetical protein
VHDREVVLDDPRGEDCDVAHTRADVEHAHPGAESGAPQELLGDRVDDRRLELETPAFPVVIAHRVAGGRGFCHWSLDAIHEGFGTNVVTLTRSGWRVH